LPLIVIIIAVLFGFRGIELSTILIIFASPSAISGYVMAQNMYNDAQLAGQINCYLQRFHQQLHCLLGFICLDCLNLFESIQILISIDFNTMCF